MVVFLAAFLVVFFLAAFLVVFFLAAFFLVVFFLVVFFLAGFFLAAFFFFGALATFSRRRASSSCARSGVMFSTVSPRRSEALVSPSVT